MPSCRGKRLATFTPSVDMGSYVVVVNADKVTVGGKKNVQKMYYRHSHRPGSFKVESFKHLQKVRHGLACLASVCMCGSGLAGQQPTEAGARRLLRSCDI